jgi:alpha-beta hydrolase superfamily lysophospholipase
MDAVTYLLPSNISLFCFDFAGCGLSEGEYISLGWFERDDLQQIVEYIRKERRASTIGLWGRSMGAVTSLLHGDRDPSIAGMVLDSPFADLK